MGPHPPTSHQSTPTHPHILHLLITSFPLIWKYFSSGSTLPLLYLRMDITIGGATPTHLPPVHTHPPTHHLPITSFPLIWKYFSSGSTLPLLYLRMDITIGGGNTHPPPTPTHLPPVHTHPPTHTSPTNYFVPIDLEVLFFRVDSPLLVSSNGHHHWWGNSDISDVVSTSICPPVAVRAHRHVHQGVVLERGREWKPASSSGSTASLFPRSGCHHFENTDGHTNMAAVFHFWG